ncbi:putative ubiquitin-conjugating enzyme E2 38 [Ricinus communis]|uniref:Ubiquitin conjugating enzyme, putative n=1 Tax=Ricinus communis TaxID=3988 RepID=B9RZS1_RICCO|nr:putative ubiquitin-conjugating enzyme E2 38 [Ricinus communis]EEF43104.1 ubiquitin conjugating enzyme, putative [Ricinus communis]|eukprot:XP_002519240.1 putative ubiquitin-conjugating enzyme E2 38 [Ricinus communis]
MEEAIKKEFKQFDIVTDYSDHHYSTHFPSSAAFADANSKVHKKIMQEWCILENNLPETIFVRVYDERIDLIRAAILGANGTPYHDNIFFFDIAFPFNYPDEPPSVYYRSHGLNLNPNLYAHGYVCLSLLNTWYGDPQENWVPSESSILQVLISLQGLVLNAKPYFNEPGAKPSNSWQEYNKDVFVLSCKTMLLSLKNPPKNFEGFVAQFFRERATTILKACDDYMNGHASIGYTIEDTSSEIELPSKFKKDLEGVYKQLEVAFNKNGIEKPKQPDEIYEGR